MSRPSNEEVKRVMSDVDTMNPSDGAYWATAHERLGLEYGEVFDIIAENPEFFGVKVRSS